MSNEQTSVSDPERKKIRTVIEAEDVKMHQLNLSYKRVPGGTTMDKYCVHCGVHKGTFIKQKKTPCRQPSRRSSNYLILKKVSWTLERLKE